MVFKQRAQQTDTDDQKESKRRIEKRSSSSDAPRKSNRSDNAIIRYFQETAVELRKVTWPTREQTLRLTLIVLGAVVVFSIFFGGLDLLFQRLMALLLAA